MTIQHFNITYSNLLTYVKWPTRREFSWMTIRQLNWACLLFFKIRRWPIECLCREHCSIVFLELRTVLLYKPLKRPWKMKIICIIISEACSLVLSSSRNIKEPASHHNSMVLWISPTEGSWLHYTRAALLTGWGGEEWKPTAEEKRKERKGRNRIRSNKGESSGPSNGKQRGRQGAGRRRGGNGKGEAVAHYFQLSFALDIVLGMWFGNVTNDVVDICRRR